MFTKFSTRFIFEFKTQFKTKKSTCTKAVPFPSTLKLNAFFSISLSLIKLTS